jgi:hypothetical protein
MAEHEQTSQTHRNWLWYARFLFACYAAGFACWMLSLLIVLFTAGFEVVEAWVIRFSGVIMTALAIMWSPLIWRRLR